MVYLYNKKEQNTDTWYKMNEPQKHVKWKKADTKAHILQICLCEISRKGKFVAQKVRLMTA